VNKPNRDMLRNMPNEVRISKKKPIFFCYRLFGRALKNPSTSNIWSNQSHNFTFGQIEPSTSKNTARKKTGIETVMNLAYSLATGSPGLYHPSLTLMWPARQGEGS